MLHSCTRENTTLVYIKSSTTTRHGIPPSRIHHAMEGTDTRDQWIRARIGALTAPITVPPDNLTLFLPSKRNDVFPCFSHGSRDARNYRGTWKGASEISPLKTDAIIKRPSGLSLRSSRAMDLDLSEISITGRGWTKEGLEVVEPGKNEGRVCNECDNNGVLNGRGKSLYGRIKRLSWKGRGSNSGEVVSL